MKTSHRLPRITGALLLAGLILSGAGGAAAAKRAKPAKDAAGAPAAAAPAGVKLNACGCYRRGESCVCTNKNAKCEYPEDCEPVGCDEKRQKELDREMAAETKRAQDEEKRRQDADREAQKEAEARDRKASGDESVEGQRAAETDKAREMTTDELLDGAGGGAGAKAPVKGSKAPRKERTKK